MKAACERKASFPTLKTGRLGRRVLANQVYYNPECAITSGVTFASNSSRLSVILWLQGSFRRANIYFVSERR